MKPAAPQVLALIQIYIIWNCQIFYIVGRSVIYAYLLVEMLRVLTIMSFSGTLPFSFVNFDDI